MIVEVVAVGTELLLGQIVNSNAAAIGARLAEAGLDHYHQSVVGDNLERLTSVLATAIARSDAVIVTGGIGPTQDDLTREAICAAIDRPMVYDTDYQERLRERWERRGRPMPDTNLKQAGHPSGGALVPNPKGSAPGVRVDAGGTWIFALPGVPAEMIPMLEDEVLPFLRRAAGLGDEVVASRLLRTWGESESRIAELLADLYEGSTNPTVAFLASAGEIKIRLTAKADSAAAADALISPVQKEIESRLGAMVFGIDGDTVEAILLRELEARSWTLGTAESATGGMIAARLTSVPGSSAVFAGSVVTYATSLKTAILGVAADAIESSGVVSEPVALAMAHGARRVLGVDAAVAVTGSAGPDELEQAAGTMVVAVATPETEMVRTLRLPGDRERVRAYTTTAALHHLRLAIVGGSPEGFWAGRRET